LESPKRRLYEEWIKASPWTSGQIDTSNYKPLLKVGVPIMFVRNIDQSDGLCNATELVENELGRNIIEAIVLAKI